MHCTHSTASLLTWTVHTHTQVGAHTDLHSTWASTGERWGYTHSCSRATCSTVSLLRLYSDLELMSVTHNPRQKSDNDSSETETESRGRQERTGRYHQFQSQRRSLPLSMVHPFPLPLIPAVAAMSPAYSHSFPSAVALTHVCVKVSWQLLPWVWKGQPPSLPNLTSSLSYDSLSLCHLFCSSLALCLQATTDGVFSDCSWRWLCRAAGVLSCSSPLFSLFYFCLSSSMRTQEPLKENPGGTNCVSRKADSFKGNF